MTDRRYIRGTASRNVVPQWIWVACQAGGFLILVGWMQLRNDPAGVQLTLKNMDERLGRIEQTLNEMRAVVASRAQNPPFRTNRPTVSGGERSEILFERNRDRCRKAVVASSGEIGGNRGEISRGQLLVGLAVKRVPEEFCRQNTSVSRSSTQSTPRITRSQSLTQETTRSSRSFEIPPREGSLRQYA